MTLADFLTARLDEDEASAKAAWGPSWVLGVERTGEPRHWRGVAAHLVALPGDPFDAMGIGDTVARSERPQESEHIARWDPARVLAELDAKRQIVEACAGPADRHLDVAVAVGDQGPLLAERILRTLALPYAGHPDYRDEWRP